MRMGSGVGKIIGQKFGYCEVVRVLSKWIISELKC